MEVKEIYKDKDQRTIEYMCNLVDQLKQDYTNVPTSWRISLDLIADNCDTYFKLKDQINKDGLYSIDGRGQTSKNPLLSTMNAIQNTIIHLISAFGCTPMSKAKMKVVNTTDVNDLISDLLE